MLKLDRNLIEESWPEEIVIVNLTKGFYYSLRGSGIFIWPLLKEGTDENLIVQTLKHHYTGDFRGSVSQLLNELKDAGLLIETEEVCAPFVPLKGAIDKKPFEPPLFQIFTEMKDLLSLDPIHDTDEAGWPNKSISLTK